MTEVVIAILLRVLMLYLLSLSDTCALRGMNEIVVLAHQLFSLG